MAIYLRIQHGNITMVFIFTKAVKQTKIRKYMEVSEHKTKKSETDEYRLVEYHGWIIYFYTTVIHDGFNNQYNSHVKVKRTLCNVLRDNVGGQTLRS